MNWFKQLFSGPAASDPGLEAGTEPWIAQARILLEKFLLTQVKEGGGRYPVDDLTILFLKCLLPGTHEHRPKYGEWLRDWNKRNIPPYLKEISDQAYRAIYQRLDEIQKNEKQRKLNECAAFAQSVLNSNEPLVEKFLEIAYRKVSMVDEYGEENPSALEPELNRLIGKLRQREPKLPELSKSSFGEAFNPTREMFFLLRARFQEYRSKRKSEVMEMNSEVIGRMTGVEFESYLCGLLRDAGISDVSSTPTTGDQGADILFSWKGSRYAIQAKRYSASVGNKAIQEAHAAKGYYRCREAWVITNSLFTPSARTLANELAVVLVDADSLMKFPSFLAARLNFDNQETSNPVQAQIESTAPLQIVDPAIGDLANQAQPVVAQIEKACVPEDARASRKNARLRGERPGIWKGAPRPEVIDWLRRVRETPKGQPLPPVPPPWQKVSSARAEEVNGSTLDGGSTDSLQADEALRIDSSKDALPADQDIAKKPEENIEDLPREVVAQALDPFEAALGRVLARARGRKGQLQLVLDPEDLADLAIIAAQHMRKHGIGKKRWTGPLIADVGEWIGPHIDAIRDEAEELYDLDFVELQKRLAEKKERQQQEENKVSQAGLGRRKGTLMLEKLIRDNRQKFLKQLREVEPMLASGEAVLSVTPEGRPVVYTVSQKKGKSDGEEL